MAPKKDRSLKVFLYVFITVVLLVTLFPFY